MQEKTLIIFNPAAGRTYPKKFKETFLKYFKEYSSTEYEWLETQIDLTNQLEIIDFKKINKIIIIGGDGTVRVVADFLLSQKIDLPIAIIPAGSANILASCLSIPFSLKRAIRTALLGKEKLIDVALFNKQLYYLTSLSLGHGSKLVKETSQGLKVRWGALAYFLVFLKNSPKHITTFEFNLDGKDYRIKGNTMLINNTLSVFKVKPLFPIDLCDGQLEILIFRSTTRFGLFLSTIFLIFARKIWPFIFTSKGKKIIIKNYQPDKIDAQLDGEIFKPEKIEVEIVPQKLKLMIPK